ncbi:haloacid dehalogenase type II [Pigmentiphaga aceris]|uniref:Haloacid dehalogenase type II n=1 Tax=Pigmentiphaga aceris TaxID=1940612 RepID=A0A5C0B0G3_9BURK|nr:haloacid dehalogenase type II [Pigmentiphaga aceris]QEI08219.1 haloacid dehalogenase type II [Pigmentiphaga aceris]
MAIFKPKYITFDCYGTLTNFDMAGAARRQYQGKVSDGDMPGFIESFRGYRLDEVLGAWKPFHEVVCNAVERTCRKWGVDYIESDGMAIYRAVPTWGPHADVPAGLSAIAKEFPLVIFSNAADEQIGHNVEKLGAPFFKVFTAQQAQVYKPRYRAFEFMLDSLGCGPEDILHVSSSLRYDLMSAYDLGIKNKVWVNRGHEPANPFYQYTEVKDTSGLAAVVGL